MLKSMATFLREKVSILQKFVEYMVQMKWLFSQIEITFLYQINCNDAERKKQTIVKIADNDGAEQQVASASRANIK